MPSSSARAQGFPVVGSGGRDVGGLALGVDVPQEPQGVRLVAPFPVGAGAGQGTLGKREGSFQAANQQIPHAQLDGPERQMARSGP